MVNKLKLIDMKKAAIIVFVIFSILSCNTKTKEGLIFKTDKGLNKKEPTIKWNVQKIRDKDGNIIAYDSTYIWSYSNLKGDSLAVNVDSVIKSFDLYFEKHFPTFLGKTFSAPYRKDPFLHEHFFKDDYFRNYLKRKEFNLEKMLDQMDSMHNLFFEENYPGLLHNSEKKSKGKINTI